MTSFSTLPANLIAIRAAAMRAIAPIKPADSTTRASPKFLFLAKRTVAGNQLPPYYLVYFLLVDLLGFEKVGKLEKVAWSIPIDFNGQAFVVEHRKLGVGVFVENPDRDEQAARQIVQRIQKAVKSARPFFHWLADQAADSSAINVLNNNNELYQRYRYLRDLHRTKAEEAERRKDERIVVQSGNSRTTTFPGFQLLDESRWVAHSAIEAFF